MLANEGPVAQVTAAILDGTPIDWPAVEATATDHDRRLLEELRLLCTLADMHRDVPARPGEKTPQEEAGEFWGRLRLIERVGAGTFGEVYRAWDPRLHREVAVKLIEIVDEPYGRRASSIIREGRLLARVRHPGVVTIYDAEQIGSRLGLSMEFVQGETLEHRLAQKGRSTAAEAIDVGIQLSEALAAVHDAGVLHRDVKASNVVVRADGRLVLMDFGAGGTLDGAAGSDATGTPLYAAPEVLQGGEATVRSDLYSLGVLLYRLVTGSYPVQAATMPDLRQAHADRSTGGNSIWTGVAPALSGVLARTIDPDPARRPDTAHELARELRGLQHKRHARWLAPVAAAALLMVTIAAGWQMKRQDGASQPMRIAVLPFEIEGSDAETRELRDGLARYLIDRLQTSPNVRVTSTMSAFSIAEANLTAADAGAQLGVSALVTGRLAKEGDGVGVDAQLITVPGGRTVWSRNYRRPRALMLDLQRSMATDMADTLQLERGQPGRWPTRSPEAYALYVRGRSALDQFSPEGTRLALQLFERALQLDPDYAQVHAALAELYLQMNNAIPHLTGEESFRRASQAATKAMAVDPTLPGAYVAAASIKSAQGDWVGAEQDYRRAIELGPSDVVARNQYSRWLALLGRFDESIEQAKIAESNDPLSPRAIMAVASALRFAGRFEEAIGFANKALQVDPRHLGAYHNLGLDYQGLGRLDEAIAAYKRSGRSSGNLGNAYAVAGRTDEALAIIKEFEQRYAKTGLGAGEIAQIYAGLGEVDLAFEWLERVDHYQAGWPTTYKVAPVWNPLRSDPRFTALLKKHGLDN